MPDWCKAKVADYIRDNAVTTAKIANSAVETVKLNFSFCDLKKKENIMLDCCKLENCCISFDKNRCLEGIPCHHLKESSVEKDYCDRCGWLRGVGVKGCTCDEKMTFFEAWEKAGDTEAVTNGTISYRKDWDYDLMLGSLSDYFEKEWSIIPNKKKVTHEIPEGATNAKVFYSDGTMFTNVRGGVKKITYEI